MKQVIDLCKRFEGFYSKPYLCPAGIATIGYGTTVYPDGTKVTLFDTPITQAIAEGYLLSMIRSVYLPGVLKLCPSLSSSRLAAIVDFAYNLGLGALKRSTLRKKINQDDWLSVPIEIMKWNKTGGRVLKGLDLRRRAECSLI